MPWSQAIKRTLIPLGSLGAVDCGVKHVLEREGGNQQGGLTDLMEFRVWWEFDWSKNQKSKEESQMRTKTRHYYSPIKNVGVQP
jgi:hypothetical protein